jgi:hypothetical protein
MTTLRNTLAATAAAISTERDRADPDGDRRTGLAADDPGRFADFANLGRGPY